MTENLHKELAARLLEVVIDLDCLNEWSGSFLADIVKKDGYLTKKQWECLGRIAATVQDEERVAVRASRRAAQ